MKNLNQLIIEYKKSKDTLNLDEIAEILYPLIRKKSTYIFYRKYYPLSLYGNNQKGYFNLSKTGLVDYEDTEQDCWVAIFNIIKNFNIKKDFYTYLYSTLWVWKPSFITIDFIKQISSLRLYIVDEEGNEPDRNLEEKSIGKIELILKNNWGILDSIEQDILTEILNNINIGHREMSMKFDISEFKITQIMNKIREKLRPYFS